MWCQHKCIEINEIKLIHIKSNKWITVSTYGNVFAQEEPLLQGELVEQCAQQAVQNVVYISYEIGIGLDVEYFEQ